MALTFAASGDRVDFNGSALGTITDGTIMMWTYPTSSTARQNVIQQIGTPDWGITIREDLAGNPIQMFRQRSTAYIAVNADSASYASYGVNKDLFIAFTWNTAGAAADQKGLIGDLTTLATEPSSYTAQTAGSGTPDITNASVYVGNGTVTTRPFIGRQSSVIVYNKPLTVAEIQAHQFNFCIQQSGCVLYSELGDNGTGTQPDWSGNAINGTVTGATRSNHAPIGAPFPGSNIIDFPGAVVAAGGLKAGTLGLMGVGI